MFPLFPALDRGLHVMATKPMVQTQKQTFFSFTKNTPKKACPFRDVHLHQVKTLKEHQLLVEKAKAKNVLLQIEVLIKISSFVIFIIII